MKVVTSYCVSSLACLLLIFSTAEAANRKRGLRGSDAICQVQLFDKMLPPEVANGTFPEEFRCRSITNGTILFPYLHIDLPDNIADAGKVIIAEESAFYLRVPGGYTHGQSIIVPNPDTLELLTAEEAGLSPSQRRRSLARADRPQTALVVRITDRSGRQPKHTATQLYRYAFQAETSLKFQYEKCSGGTTIINPKDDGVVEVTVNRNIRDSGSADAAVAEAQEILVSRLRDEGIRVNFLEEYASLVLYVVPSSGNWLAYAVVNGGLSVYNGEWGGYVHALMHEVGHNFGLWHSNDDLDYNDHTSYMSGSITGYHDQEEFPANCFNAANHWKLGWFLDRRITVSRDDSARIVKLAAFVDYRDLPVSSDYQVLVRISEGDMVAQWNRAKEFNQDVYERKNDLVIVEQATQSTELIRGLGEGERFQNIEVCGAVEALGNDPEHLVVSIGQGSACQDYWDSLNTVSQQSGGSGGPCLDAMQECFEDADCCSGKCAESGVASLKICTASLDDILGSDRKTPDVKGSDYRSSRGN